MLQDHPNGSVIKEYLVSQQNSNYIAEVSEKKKISLLTDFIIFSVSTYFFEKSV